MNILGILVGRAEDDESTSNICSLFNGCPYNLVNTVQDGVLFLLFNLPEGHRWWLEGIQDEPGRTLGLCEAEVFFSHMDVEPLEVVEKMETPPCGSDCERCVHLHERCKGCPSVCDIHDIVQNGYR